MLSVVVWLFNFDLTMHVEGHIIKNGYFRQTNGAAALKKGGVQFCRTRVACSTIQGLLFTGQSPTIFFKSIFF